MKKQTTAILALYACWTLALVPPAALADDAPLATAPIVAPQSPPAANTAQATATPAPADETKADDAMPPPEAPATIVPVTHRAIQKRTPHRKKSYLSPDTVSLSKKESRAVSISSAYSSSGPQPFMQDGKLTFTYGAGGVPTIVAAPLQIVDVEFEPGELVQEVVIGDHARWETDTGKSGNTAHLFIKATDVGLMTSVVVTTDRRTYHLRLVSKPEDYTPYVGFVYESNLKQQLAVQKAAENKQNTWQTTTTTSGTSADLAKLNFNYVIKGDAPWKPERVYDDGLKTYIQFPASIVTGEMPALMVKKGKKDVLVNYRVRGQVMEVDGLFETIALVVGVNGGLFGSGFGGEKQQLIEITRKSRGGW